MFESKNAIIKFNSHENLFVFAIIQFLPKFKVSAQIKIIEAQNRSNFFPTCTTKRTTHSLEVNI